MTKNRFRILFILSVLLSLVPGRINESTIPPRFTAMVAQEPPPLTVHPFVNQCADVAFAVTGIGSLVGILLFRRWGRALLIAFHLSAYALTPLDRLVVISSGWGSACHYVVAMFTGAVIAMCYLPPVSGYFVRKSNPAID